MKLSTWKVKFLWRMLTWSWKSSKRWGNIQCACFTMHYYRQRHQADHRQRNRLRCNCDLSLSLSSSVNEHTLDVVITSPTFTDVNLRYAGRSDGASASIYSPNSGSLGLQFYRANPSLMGAKLYGRYPVSIINKTLLIRLTLRKWKRRAERLSCKGSAAVLGN